MFFSAVKNYKLGLISLIIVVGLLVYFMARETWTGFFMAGVLGLLALWLWLGFGYHISGEKLSIKFGPFRREINLDQIMSIKKIEGNRFKITLRNGKTVKVAPQDTEMFFIKMYRTCPLLGIKLQKGYAPEEFPFKK